MHAQGNRQQAVMEPEKKTPSCFQKQRCRDGELEFKDAAEAAKNEKPENGAAKLLLPNKEPLVLPKPNDGSAGSANAVFVAVKARRAGEN